MKRFIYSIHILLVCSICCNAQIGYHVSLLNSATGEPRANETVRVQVEITNSENSVICSETKSATTNEFGVLSLQIGSSSTFENVDWSKLPLYVSATVDGIMIGKSQILNVPVAEAAKTLVNVDPDLICKTWTASNLTYHQISLKLTLTRNSTFSYYLKDGNGEGSSYVLYGAGKYVVQGNLIILCNSSGEGYELPTCLIYNEGNLYGGFGSIGNAKFY